MHLGAGSLRICTIDFKLLLLIFGKTRSKITMALTLLDMKTSTEADSLHSR